jgi:hypothetical protein
MAGDIRAQAEELVRYYSELVRRLAQTGVRDIADLLALYEQLRRALDAISRQELGWAAEQADRLRAELSRLDTDLSALRRLKSAVDASPTVAPGVRAAS